MNKNIDESWKDNVEKEKQGVGGDTQPQQQLPPVSFPLFISSLGMQALMALGEIENPVTKKKERDLIQARYIIDTIQILQEKTISNTTQEEKKMLEELLYQLRMVYVEKDKSEK